MIDGITKELIFDHFAHKTTPLQRKMIYEWLQNEAREEQYYAWLEEWERANPQYDPNTEKYLSKYTAYLVKTPTDQNGNNIRKLIKSNIPATIWSRWSVVASLMLLLILSTLAFREKLFNKTYKTNFGEIYSFRLNDGSEVTLNANSSLRLSRFQFSRRIREVFLIGEARFSVTHKPDNQHFIVKTGNDFEVLVQGTEFEVYARRQGRKVVLNKGKVQLHYLQGNTAKQVLLKPGDHFSLDQQNNLVQNTFKPLKNFASWEQKRFVFDENSLQEVAIMLQENYGLEVKIESKELAERIIMGSFKAENEDELLKSISELLDITVLKEGNQVQLIEK